MIKGILTLLLLLSVCLSAQTLSWEVDEIKSILKTNDFEMTNIKTSLECVLHNDSSVDAKIIKQDLDTSFKKVDDGVYELSVKNGKLTHYNLTYDTQNCYYALYVDGKNKNNEDVKGFVVLAGSFLPMTKVEIASLLSNKKLNLQIRWILAHVSLTLNERNEIIARQLGHWDEGSLECLAGMKEIARCKAIEGEGQEPVKSFMDSLIVCHDGEDYLMSVCSKKNGVQPLFPVKQEIRMGATTYTRTDGPWEIIFTRVINNPASSENGHFRLVNNEENRAASRPLKCDL